MSDEKPSWIRHTLEQQPWRNQTQLVAVLTLVVIVGITIGALYLIQTTTTTTTGRELEKMTEKRVQLELDNERLRAEIAELESLPRVMTRAAELGFREAEPEEIQWISVEGYRYDRPQVTVTPSPTPVEAEPVYDETLTGWLKKQWDSFREQYDQWRDGD